MSSYGEVLATFKRTEDSATVYLVMQDTKLAEALSVWPNVPITYLSSQDCVEDVPTKQWAWLWKHCKVDLVTFSLILGVSPEQAKAMAARLIGLRLVYPDGQVQSYCRQFLSTLVMERIDKARKLSNRAKKE